MSEDVLILPARITVSGLAGAIDRDERDVQASLAERGLATGPDEVLGAETAIAVAGEFGVEATVEPRDLALEQLYEYETRGEYEGDVGGRAGAIVDAVVSDIDDLDEMIESVAERWSVARMPVIDRNIIRIAVHELRDSPTTPAPVVISEAVRLARTYSTEKSPSFVNGVLATLAKTIRES